MINPTICPHSTCDFRESSPRPSEQPTSTRGTSIARPLSYVGGAAVREDRRLNLVPAFRARLPQSCRCGRYGGSEATGQTPKPKPKRKIDRQTRRQSRTKPLSMTAVRMSRRGETHCGAEETRGAKPQLTQSAARVWQRVRTYLQCITAGQQPCISLLRAATQLRCMSCSISPPGVRNR